MKIPEKTLKKFNDKHNYFYDYSKSNYIKATVKIEIICPIHGSFWQLPYNHYRSGCVQCGIERQKKAISLTTESFITKSIERHGNKYDYSQVDYKDNKTKVKIICPEHGLFEQAPSTHLNNNGCGLCGIKQTGITQRKTHDQWVKEMKILHNNKYDYSLANYTKAKDSTTIICKQHGEFIQKINDHNSGCGCPICGDLTTGRRFLDEPTILYIIHFTEPNLYKIGITVKRLGVEKRYIGESLKYEIIETIEFDTGKDAFLKEQELLKKYNEFKYFGDNILKTGGNSELLIPKFMNKYKEDKMSIKINKKYENRYVITRTNSAGVWFGLVSEVDSEVVILNKARRMYKWKVKGEGITLSHVAISGIDKEESSIQGPLDDVALQWIELLPCSLESIATFNAQPVAQAQ